MNKEKVIWLTKELLNEGLSERVELSQQGYAIHLEQVRESLLELRVEAYKELCKRREQYRHPKDKDYTDFDRQTMLNAAVADVEAEYQLVKGLEDLVRERVELIKILLEVRW